MPSMFCVLKWQWEYECGREWHLDDAIVSYLKRFKWLRGKAVCRLTALNHTAHTFFRGYYCIIQNNIA